MVLGLSGGIQARARAPDLVFDSAHQPGLTEPSAAQLKDYSKFKNHGTITGATWVQLPYGLWVQALDGNDYVTIPNHLSLDITSDFTIEAWIAGPLGGENPTTIVSKTNWSISAVGGYGIFRSSTGEIHCQVSTGGACGRFYNLVTISADTWTHVAVTFAKGGNVIGYRNGSPGAPQSVDFYYPGSNALDVLIGQDYDVDRNFIGRLSFARIHNRVLSEAEIAFRATAKYRYRG